MFSSIIILCVAVHSILIAKVQEVIIIGAGISGLRASQLLTQQNIPHLLIESKAHLGGRIAQSMFNGMFVDTGACFLSDFNSSSNPLASAVKRGGWPYSQADLSFQNIYDSQWQKLTDDKWQIDHSNKLYRAFMKRVDQKLMAQKGAKSLEQIIKTVSTQKPLIEKGYKQLIRLMAYSQENIQGAQLSQLSARYTHPHYSHTTVFLLGSFLRFFQKLFKADLSLFRLQQTVLSIDYSSKEFIRVITNKGEYRTKKVISSIPLGVLQAGTVKFTPPLPRPYQEVIGNIGNGIVEKLFVSFSKPFWGSRRGWISLLSQEQGNRYSSAFILPHTTKHILIFFVSGAAATELADLSQPQILSDLKKYLWLFFDKGDFEISQVEYTHWHRDPQFRGSYSYYKVATQPSDFLQLSKPIENRLWFTGEHTHSEHQGLVQGAYEAGQRAARQVLASFKRLVSLEYASEDYPFKTHVYQSLLKLGQLHNILEKYRFKPVK